ncbi:MAG: hypothetical protein GY820_03775 [Gammaproteobacteria bacterium]|nr:hypothetical protein [Gammaproteobacteria bacterium]
MRDSSIGNVGEKGNDMLHTQWSFQGDDIPLNWVGLNASSFAPSQIQSRSAISVEFEDDDDLENVGSIKSM